MEVGDWRDKCDGVKVADIDKVGYLREMCLTEIKVANVLKVGWMCKRCLDEIKVPEVDKNGWWG